MTENKNQPITVLADSPYTLNLVNHCHFFEPGEPEKHQKTFPIQASSDEEAIEKARQAVDTGGIAAELSDAVGYIFARPEAGEEPRHVSVRYIMYCKDETPDGHTVRSEPIGFFARDEKEMYRIFESYPVKYRNVCYAPWGIVANVPG